MLLKNKAGKNPEIMALLEFLLKDTYSSLLSKNGSEEQNTFKTVYLVT
jgi:hypothetical protein